MPKNILIFSDGTGQSSGFTIEERRSNIYKLYRASRSGPDSTVDPRLQFAFYDPGIGTLPEGMGYFLGMGRKIYNMVSQATGYGITMNIIDCYAAIIQAWEPGDRIFLFGFSRGAYTIRCLASVLTLCGVPTRQKDGSPLRFDRKSVRKIAKEAVKKVYQHVSSPKDHRFVPQRVALAKKFRKVYQSGEEQPNAEPYFVGVFDTVAALVNWPRLGIATFVLSLAGLFISAGFWVLLRGLKILFPMLPALGFLQVLGGLAVLGIAGALIAFIWNNTKFAFGLEGFPFWKTVHWNPWKFEFYDDQLSQNVRFARHALSIDEQRGDFDRVAWGEKGVWPAREANEPAWLKQVWFAGNHSDVGGSYLESEARLSDISLKWMSDQIMQLPHPVLFDETLLRTYPDPLGMQHDERKASCIFRLGKRIVRKIDPAAKLHESVIQRLEAPQVLQFDVREPYRPEALASHNLAKKFFEGKS